MELVAAVQILQLLLVFFIFIPLVCTFHAHLCVSSCVEHSHFIIIIAAASTSSVFSFPEFLAPRFDVSPPVHYSQTVHKSCSYDSVTPHMVKQALSRHSTTRNIAGIQIAGGDSKPRYWSIGD
jgi:hypothetical protein